VFNRYDPSLDEWFPCAPMPTERMKCQRYRFGRKNFVVGGNDGQKA